MRKSANQTADLTINMPASIGVTIGATLNMGDYESLKISIYEARPCNPDQKSIDKTFENVFKDVMSKLNGKIKAIRKGTKSNKPTDGGVL